MSVAEMIHFIDARYEAEEEELKHDIILRFIQAQVTANYVGQIFTPPKKRREEDIPMPWTFFPEMFKEEKEADEKRKSDANLAMQKAQMQAYADRWNRRRGQEK